MYSSVYMMCVCLGGSVPYVHSIFVNMCEIRTNQQVNGASDETSPPQMFLFVCLNNIYTWDLEPKMTLVLVGKGPCFGGLTFKNRGHLGSSYIDLIEAVEKSPHTRWNPKVLIWFVVTRGEGQTRSQFWNLLPVWNLLRCWCITILIDFYILVLPSCMSFLKRRQKIKLGWPLFPPKLWKSSPDPGSSPSRKERNLV